MSLVLDAKDTELRGIFCGNNGLYQPCLLNNLSFGFQLLFV
jgi:hypothetical protein